MRITRANSAVIALCAGVVIAAPSRASAQWEDAARIATEAALDRNSCLAAIPPAGLVQMAVFLQAIPRDELSGKFSASDTVHASPAVLDVEDRFVEAMASHIRSSLGAVGESIPAADSVLTWHALTAHLWITLLRNDSVAVRAQTVWMTRDDTAALRLLQRAAESTQASSSRLRWPARQPGDSLSFGVGFISPTGDSAGAVYQIPARAAAPVFSVAEPWYNAVRITRSSRGHYPGSSASNGWGGALTVSFVVDSMGRVDPATFAAHGLPPGASESQRDVYDRFAAVAKQVAVDTRYAPASIGGCKIPLKMVQPFTFDIAK